jgi:hypothetical protein
MSLKIVSQNYSIKIRGDGSSSSIIVDFYDQIRADNTVHNKTPDGVLLGNTEATGVLSGTEVTFTWSTPLGNGAIDTPTVQFTFAK